MQVALSTHDGMQVALLTVVVVYAGSPLEQQIVWESAEVCDGCVAQNCQAAGHPQAIPGSPQGQVLC